MAEEKASRTPAGERGTDHQIDTGHGHYWVRLITRGAIKREGECMVNCCRHGTYSDDAGPEGLDETALWSLRRETDAVSIALARVDCDGELVQFNGPMNNQPSGTAFRQLRQLREYLLAGGATVEFPYRSVIVDDEGNTYRPDKAPKHVLEAIEAKQSADRKARQEVDQEYLRQARERNPEAFHLQPGQLMIRPHGRDNFRPLSQLMPFFGDGDMDEHVFIERVPGERRDRVAVNETIPLRVTLRGGGIHGAIERMVADNLLRAFRRGPEPRTRPRPDLPDLTLLPSPQARMRAIRENREARLADRHWVRENERSQKRLAR